MNVLLVTLNWILALYGIGVGIFIGVFMALKEDVLERAPEGAEPFDIAMAALDISLRWPVIIYRALNEFLNQKKNED